MENDMPAVDAFEYNMNSFLASKMLFACTLIAALCGLFLAVTFLQSGFNKVRDYSGNRSYFASVFEKTFLRSVSGMLLPVIMVLEILSGLGMLTGTVLMYCYLNPNILGYSLALSALTLIMLLTGQRIAKDYAGAASLTGYFIISILGLFGYALAW